MASIFPKHIFVYGTLVKGYSNHFLMEKCTFVGPAVTKKSYGLHVKEYPFVTAKVPVSQIHGELYTVPDLETLDELDLLEDHPVVYERKPVVVIVSLRSKSNECSIAEVEAELYFNENIDITDDSVELVSSGRFVDSVLGARHKTHSH